MQIIRDLFFGKIHFKEFQEDKPKLSNKILSKRLKELESYFLVDFLRNLLILPLHF
ncbi:MULTISPECIES: winged helix-turn-helix transcriptional regulator [Methanosphaera]|uniref:winged helix-turn-helix transcriptional regulator n=1 Tax=Methanosphaera TaxID=2316 RepID=UPI00338F5085